MTEPYEAIQIGGNGAAFKFSITNCLSILSSTSPMTALKIQNKI